MKIREIHSLNRQYEIPDETNLEEIKKKLSRSRRQSWEWVFDGNFQKNQIFVKFQIDKGDGWEDFDPEV